MGKAQRLKAEKRIKAVLTIPDLSQPRPWYIANYSKDTEKYILNTVILVEHSDKPQAIISCLGCQQKLEAGQTYVGFKNEETKEFVVTF